VNQVKAENLKIPYKHTEKFPNEKLQNIQNLPLEDIIKLVEELYVHNIELEEQNENLHKAQSELTESRDRLSDLFDFAPIGYFILDQKGLIRKVNITAANLLGIEKESLIKVEFSRIVVPDFHNIFHHHQQEVLKTRSKQNCELKLIRKDGMHFDARMESVIVCDKGSNCNQFRTSVIDITERKQARQALQESEKNYQELFNSVMEGIGIVDENEIIRFCNPAYAKIFDKESAADLIDKCILEFIPEDQKEIFYAETEKSKNRLSSQYELSILTTRGNIKNILLSVTPRFGSGNNNHIGSFITMIDITETKQLQKIISRAQRLETAGKIAGQVAHDFNNLLGPLVAYPDFIKNELPENHPVIPLIDDIKKAADQMAEINQQLLTLGRRGHYKLKPLNINEIIKQVKRDIEQAPDTVVIETDLCKNLMNIKGGASQIYRLVSNIVNNALDAMEHTGQLAIKTENYYIDTMEGKYGLVPKGEYVKLTISDTGCGIFREIQSKIFDPFFTTKTTDKKKGSGLGLSVVDAVLKDHEGYIDFDSTIGEGTSFYLYFPITRDLIDMSIDIEIVGGTESILVVDDDRMQHEVTSRLLRELGYKATTVESGEKAIEFLKSNAQDLLLLNMTMSPGIDGTETYRWALEINPSQRAIIISGYSETDRVREALNMGAGGYIRKPLTLKTIARAVRNELDRVPEHELVSR